MSNWLSTKQVADALKIEAEGDAVRLQHLLIGWEEVGATYRNKCGFCGEYVIVTPRGVLRIRGEVVSLQCSNKIRNWWV